MARTVNPNWPQGYSMPYGIILSKNLGGELLLLGGLAGHQLEGGEHLHCASLVFVCPSIIIIIILSSFFVLSSCLYLNP